MLLEKRNFLPLDEFNGTFGTIRNNTAFPWFYSKNTAYDDTRENEDTINLWDFSFSNNLYIDGKPESFVGERSVDLLKKICQHFNLKLKEVIRIRAGLITRTPTPITHNPHVDYTFPHCTALFYLSTCNGFTTLYNQKWPNDTVLTEMTTVMTEENKVIVFDGLQYHSSTSQTDTKQRIVINFNFTIEE
jgi:hypothetical protein